MDKYEFNLKVEQLKKLVNLKDYESAMKIADSIDWRRVKDSGILAVVSEIYENNGEFSEAKEILLLAYEHSSFGKRLLYKLTELAIKDNSIKEAESYYKEFEEIARTDTRLFLLRYKLLKAMGSPIAQQIVALEQYKAKELDEKYMYELALLYHEAGMSEKCIMLCDDIVLMFGIGKYVDKAIELKTVKEGRELSDYQQNLLNNRPEFEARLSEVEREFAVADDKNSQELVHEEIARSLREDVPEEDRFVSDKSLDEIDFEIAKHMEHLESGESEIESIESALKELTAEAEGEEILEETDYDEEYEISESGEVPKEEYEPDSVQEEENIGETLQENVEPETAYEVKATNILEEAQNENAEEDIVEVVKEAGVTEAEDLKDAAFKEHLSIAEESVEIEYKEDLSVGKEPEEVSKGSLGIGLSEKGSEETSAADFAEKEALDIEADKTETVEEVQESAISNVSEIYADTQKTDIKEITGNIKETSEEYLEEVSLYPKNNSVIIAGSTEEEALEAGLSLLRRRYEVSGKKPVIKITAEKLNLKGLEESLDKISSKDLVIENVANLSKRNIEIMLAVANDPSIGTDFVLTDSVKNVKGLLEEYPELSSYIDIDYGTEEIKKEEPVKEELVVKKEAVKEEKLVKEKAPVKKEIPVKKETAAKKEVLNKAVKEPVKETIKEQPVEEEYEKTKIISKDIEEVKEVLKSRQEKSKEDLDEVLDIDDFAKFACEYAGEIGCSISGKSMLALYERIEIMDDEGDALTKKNAMILITNAADRAEKPSLFKRLRNMLTFSKSYDREGKLILKEEHFIL